MKPNSLLAVSLCLTASALPVEHAFAQTGAQPPRDDASVAEGNIIVTAQKIEQRATDVPITLSVLDGGRMEAPGVSDLDELSNYVPGLNIQGQSANNPGSVIRGITFRFRLRTAGAACHALLQRRGYLPLARLVPGDLRHGTG